MSVSGSSAASPSRAVSRLRNSTAPSESRPASISGASADTLGSSSAATSRTDDDKSTVGGIACTGAAAAVAGLVGHAEAAHELCKRGAALPGARSSQDERGHRRALVANDDLRGA